MHYGSGTDVTHVPWTSGQPVDTACRKCNSEQMADVKWRHGRHLDVTTEIWLHQLMCILIEVLYNPAKFHPNPIFQKSIARITTTRRVAISDQCLIQKMTIKSNKWPIMWSLARHGMSRSESRYKWYYRSIFQVNLDWPVASLILGHQSSWSRTSS